jgi:peptidoglycan/xylan/chitin deacetylase (PgdA/CDA1 family)
MGHRDIARHAFHSFGGMHALRWLHRNGVTVLMYHKFPADRALLRSQCEYLRKHHHIIGLTQVSRLLREKRAIPPRSVVLTIDDGHRSVYQHGYPVFAEFGFPVTVYLTTGPIDDRGWLWFDRVAHMFMNSPRTTVELPNLDGLAGTDADQIIGKAIALGTRDQRLDLSEQYMTLMKQVPAARFSEFFSALEASLGVKAPEGCTSVQWESLTWEEIKAMSRGGIEFGGHTITHPILSRSDEAMQRNEIAGCKQRIESELDKPVLHFAYPNGKPEDFSSSTVEIVRNTGFETATTTSFGQVFQGDDLYRLKRLPVDPKTPEYSFRQHAAGLRR